MKGLARRKVEEREKLAQGVSRQRFEGAVVKCTREVTLQIKESPSARMRILDRHWLACIELQTVPPIVYK